MNNTNNISTVEVVERYILQREGVNLDSFLSDTHIAICDADLYNFVDFVFTLAEEYKYETAEDICTKVVDEVYNIINYTNNKRNCSQHIHAYDFYFADMKEVYEAYAQKNVQRKAKIRAGLI